MDPAIPEQILEDAPVERGEEGEPLDDEDEAILSEVWEQIAKEDAEAAAKAGGTDEEVDKTV